MLRFHLNLLVYYVLPVTGLNLGAFTSGILAITLNSAAFVSEILRGGLTSVPKGQFEAAKSLGVSSFALWGRVILPQTFIASIPPLVNEFTQVLKATAQSLDQKDEVGNTKDYSLNEIRK